MRIQLSNLQVEEAKSRTRLVFSADILVDGALVGVVRHPSRGALTFSFDDPKIRVQFEQFVGALPPFDSDGTPITMTPSFYWELLAHQTHEWENRGQIGPRPSIRHGADYA